MAVEFLKNEKAEPQYRTFWGIERGHIFSTKGAPQSIWMRTKGGAVLLKSSCGDSPGWMLTETRLVESSAFKECIPRTETLTINNDIAGPLWSREIMTEPLPEHEPIPSLERDEQLLDAVNARRRLTVLETPDIRFRGVRLDQYTSVELQKIVGLLMKQVEI